MTPAQIAFTKDEFRRTMLSRRRALSDSEAARLGLAAQQRLLEQELWQSARVVLLYSAVRREADTRLLWTMAREQGKEVLFPRCRQGQAGEMDAALVRGQEDLRPGAYGIPEPGLERPLVDPGQVDLVVAPGVAFDRQGFRLGYGGGFYDRFLARGAGPAVGLAYDFQLVDTLPVDPWDRPMRGVCTEEIFLCS